MVVSFVLMSGGRFEASVFAEYLDGSRHYGDLKEFRTV